MGRYLDVTGYPGEKSALDLNTGLSSLGDALTDVLARRQKAQQFKDQLDFDREDAQRKFAQNQGNLDYQNRIIDQRERRDELKFNQDQGEMQRRATMDAAKAMAEGNPEMAKAILHGAVSYDPATGQETGRGEIVPGQMRDVGPAPQEPQAPAPAQPVPPEVAARRRGRTSTYDDEAQSFYQSQGRPMPEQTGVDPFAPPAFTDDGKPPQPDFSAAEYHPETRSMREQATSDMVAEEQARMDAAEHDKAQTAFEAASQAYPHLRTEYDAKQAAARGEQPYTIRFGANDPGVEINPAALRYGRRQAAAEDFIASLHGLNLDERGQRAAQAARAALLAGEDPQTVYKAFDAARMTGQRFQDTTELQTQKDIAARERALIAGPRNPGDFHVGQLHEQQEAGTVRDLKVFEEQFKDWERQAAQLGTESKGYANLERAVKNAAAPGGIQQHEAMSALSRYFGGGVAREFEQKFLFQHLAGYGARAQSMLQNIDNGQFGPDELAAIASAVRDARGEAHDRAGQLYESAYGSFGPGTGHDYFGGNVDARVRGAMKALGYEAEPMYPGMAPVQLGDIVRPYRSQLHGRGQAPPPSAPPAPAAPVRPAGAPPEIKSRDKGKKNKAVDDALGALGG